VTEEDKKERNRALMPGVAELVDAHNEAFADGPEFVVLRSIEYTTHHRVTRRGIKPYEFPDEDIEAVNQELYVLDESDK